MFFSSPAEIKMKTSWSTHQSLKDRHEFLASPCRQLSLHDALQLNAASHWASPNTLTPNVHWKPFHFTLISQLFADSRCHKLIKMCVGHEQLVRCLFFFSAFSFCVLPTSSHTQTFTYFQCGANQGKNTNCK